MTVRQLYDARDAIPFQPFDIHLSDGRSLIVRHPEMLSISSRNRTAVVYGSDDSWEVIDVDLVTSVRIPAAVAAV
jgi:hypothetical protein